MKICYFICLCRFQPKLFIGILIAYFLSTYENVWIDRYNSLSFNIIYLTYQFAINYCYFFFFDLLELKIAFNIPPNEFDAFNLYGNRYKSYKFRKKLDKDGTKIVM